MKTVLITGASKGIGKALAQKYLQEGWKAIGTSTTGKADFSHENLSIFQLDLSSPGSIETCVRAIQETRPAIDVFHNNAGALLDDEETVLIVEKLRQTLEINLIGTIDFTGRLLNYLNPDAHIVNTSSQAGSLSDADNMADTHYPYHYPAYKISKAALNMYTRTLANSLRSKGSEIIVSSVNPGWVKTDMGGDEAPIEPEEAAEDLYKLATSRPPTGQFWYKGERYPW